MAQQAGAEAGQSATTVTVEPTAPTEEAEPTLRLQLHRPPNQRRVMWQKDTIDNENMGKKKSKCCCVYRKPHPFGESSSDEEDDCANCVGHRKPKPAAPHSAPEGTDGAGPSQ